MNIINARDFAQLEHIDLSQFFSLICSDAHRHPVIWQKRQPYEVVWTVYHCAKTIFEDWNCDWSEMGKTDEFFVQCQEMYQEWDYKRMDPLEAGLTQRGNFLKNGHHRSFVLGSLLLQDKVQFQPVPVLNVGKLIFDPSSDKTIEIKLTIPEFLGVKLESGLPIGTIPATLRTANWERYKSQLTTATQIWKSIIKESPPPHCMRAKIEQVTNNLTSFDALAVEDDDRDIAIAAAFICDAINHQIQAEKTFFVLFDPTMVIHPPYLLC